MTNRKILVTSALPYANGDIHLGHLMEAIQTDIWVRFQRLRGHDCVYVCADDAHGTAIMLSAEAEQTTAETLIAETEERHKTDYDGFSISFDNFYSTHSDENKYLSETKKYKKVVIRSHRFNHQGTKIGKDYKINVGEVSLAWTKIPLSKKMDTQNIFLKNIKIPGVIKIMSANIGNPHCVVLVKKINSIDLERLGPMLVKHSLFPNQANITFVEKINSRSIKVLFWERGGGHTLACGSGTCATAFVLHHNNLVGSKIRIKTEQSFLETDIQDKMVYLKGHAEIVYQSIIQI